MGISKILELEVSLITFKEIKIQCCGSGMFIPDPNFYHSGSRIQGQKKLQIPDPDPHQRV
jgi:hypothetical protein